MTVLKLTEFIRRVAKQHDLGRFKEEATRLRDILLVVLDLEAWRRWARGSFLRNTPFSNPNAPGDIFFLWDIMMEHEMHVTEGVDDVSALPLSQIRL